MYKEDLALNNLQRLICHKKQPNCCETETYLHHGLFQHYNTMWDNTLRECSIRRARMVIWTTRNKGLYDDANFSHRDLVLYFRHQLRVKIRCDRKRLDRITFSKRWVTAASLVVRKGGNVGVILPSSAGPWLLWYGSLGTPPLVSRILFFSLAT